MFYSKSTGGFYDISIHGEKIPDDAIEISSELYVELLNAQSNGKIIIADANGNPIAVDPPPLSHNDVIKAQIVAFESTVTQRRLREAALGTDNGWLAGVNTQIATLRTQLT